MRKILFLATLLLALAFNGVAQIVTTTPAILQESSKNVVLTYHADSPIGNLGLADNDASDPVYAHIGVITNKSNREWKNGPEWLDNAAKYKLNFVKVGTWTLTIGDIRTYFNITDPTEKVEQIAIVFRNADASKSGRTASGGDIYVDVFPEGFQLQFNTNAASTVIGKPSSMSFTAITSSSASITIAVNGNSIATATGKTELTATHTFSSTGSYEVTATATSGNETVSKTINIAYPGASTKGTYPGGVPKMGSVLNSDGTVTFCLAAPGKSSVVLVPSWDDYKVLDKNIMQYQDYNGQRYFFITVSGLNKTDYYPYYYIVDAQYKVADPYARLVLDNYSDKWLDYSVWPDMPRYPYEKFDDTMLAVYKANMDNDYQFSDFTIPDHDQLVIYELLFRDFTGTEGAAEGNGTIAKARQKLSYLESLGVNAIELMPVMEFNGNNSWGYNTNFYFAPDKAYGSPHELKAFIDAAHKHGMAVILDIVFNQSDGLHPWYQMYDIDSNPFYNKVAPHDYSVLNDWKQENPLVQQQWIDALTMWLTAYNVDGFRFDLVKGLGTSYPNGTEAYNASRVATMKTLNAAMKKVKPNVIHINENLAGQQEEDEMAADGQLNWANRTCYSSCQFTMGYAEGSNLEHFLSTKDGRSAFSTISFAESHDEERMGYKQNAYGADGIKGNVAASTARLGALAAQMLLTPGPKMIWQFGELGADESEKTSSGNNVDPKLVIWSRLEDNNYKALHDVYQALLHLRLKNPELFARTANFFTTGFANNLTSKRIMRLTAGDKEVMCFINPAVKGSSARVGGSSTILNSTNSQLICASPGFTGSLSGTGKSVSVTLPANSFAVFATRTTSGVDEITTDNVSGTSNVTVHGGAGEILIDGEYTNASVYNIQGVRQAGLKVAPGLYIVNVDGNVSRVLVY